MAPRMGRPSLQAQRRLVHALSSRVPMWEEQDHHRILERAGSMPDPVDAAPDHHHDGDGGDDGAGGSPSGGGVGEDYALSATWRRDPRRQLRLLQEALCPLTFTSGDLRPHSQPKARELYETLLQGAPKAPWYMINPDGPFRLFWDILMLVFTAALIIYVPALIAFYAPATECVFLSGHQPAAAAGPHAPPQPAMSVQFLTLTNAAFMLDIVLNFLTGVRRFNRETGMVEYSYDFKIVFLTYAKGWLLLDVVSTLPLECIVLAADRSLDSFNAGYLNRMLKVFAITRRAHGDPFRVVNLLPFFSNNFNYSMRLVVISASLLLLSLHYFACALWLVLRVQGFPPKTWPVELQLLDGPVHVYEAWTWGVFSVTSAMIGLGYGSYPPVTYAEAVLWTIEMITMAAGWATVNGFILSAILEFLAAQARHKTLLMQAQREVDRRGLPPPLKQAVMSYLKLKHHDENTQDSGAFMQGLAPALRLQVALASVSQALSRLPVLRDSRQLLQRTALLVEHQVAPEGQLIVIPGTCHKQLYFITRGYADVYLGKLLVDTLAAGDSFGEPALLPVPPLAELPPRLAALWGRESGFSARAWPCLYCIRALSACSLLVLDAEAFAELLQEYGWAEERMRQLGRRHAAVLDSLPMLDEIWAAAAGADPNRDPAADVMSRNMRANARRGAEGAKEAATKAYRAAAAALARPGAPVGPSGGGWRTHGGGGGRGSSGGEAGADV